MLEPYIGAVNISKYYTIELVYIYIFHCSTYWYCNIIVQRKLFCLYVSYTNNISKFILPGLFLVVRFLHKIPKSNA